VLFLPQFFIVQSDLDMGWPVLTRLALAQDQRNPPFFLIEDLIFYGHL
jgi:hypothetical protein